MTKHAEVPISRRDRPWVDQYVTVLCGPFDMPTTDALRQAVTALTERYPDSRITWSLHGDRGCWVNDRTVDSIVVERDWDDDVDLGARHDAIVSDESLDPPLTLIRYPRHLALKMSHSVGDGRMFLTIMVAVLHTAFLGQVVPWPAEASRRSPLATAAWRTFGRHPALIKAAIGDRFSLPVEDTGTDVQPWSPSRRNLQITIPRERADDVLEWGRKTYPAATRVSLQMTMFLRALKKVGLEISNDIRVVVDLRRYLGWQYIDGNFVAGVPMNIDASMSPEQVSATIKATNTSGRPLAGYAQMAVAGLKAMPAPTSVNHGERPRVTFTDIGRSAEVDSLPFLDDSPVVYAGSIPPEGPLGITVLTGETARMMGVTVTFHDNVVDAGLIRAALALVESDPIALLSEAEPI